MRRLMPILLLCLLSRGPVGAQEWIIYTDEAQRFSVNLPGDPVVKDIDYLSELGATIPARLYTVDGARGHYSLTVVDYTQAPRIHAARCAQQGYECDGFEVGTEVRGAIAFAAWNFRKSTNGEITYDAYAQVDGIPGHQLQIVNPDGSQTFVAIHLNARRLYILEASVPAQAPPPGMFQQSLVILDENGDRIRYIYDDNDQPVRVEAASYR